MQRSSVRLLCSLMLDTCHSWRYYQNLYAENTPALKCTPSVSVHTQIRPSEQPGGCGTLTSTAFATTSSSGMTLSGLFQAQSVDRGWSAL